MGTSRKPSPPKREREDPRVRSAKQILAQLAERLNPAADSPTPAHERAPGGHVRVRIPGAECDLVVLEVPRSWSELTEREIEIVRQARGERSNQDIATALNISVNTVKAHLMSIFRKMGVHSRVAMFLLAIVLDAPGMNDLSASVDRTAGQESPEDPTPRMRQREYPGVEFAKKTLAQLAERLYRASHSRAPARGRASEVHALVRIPGAECDLVVLEVPRSWSELTERELEIVRQASGERSNHDIATALNISVNTVKAHLRSIYRKLGVRSRVAMPLLAILLDAHGIDDLSAAVEPTAVEQDFPSHAVGGDSGHSEPSAQRRPDDVGMFEEVDSP